MKQLRVRLHCLFVTMQSKEQTYKNYKILSNMPITKIKTFQRLIQDITIFGYKVCIAIVKNFIQN